MRQICLKVFLPCVLVVSGCASPTVVLYPKPDPAATALDVALAKKAAQKPVGPEIPVALPKYGDRVTVSFLGDATTLLTDVVKARGGLWALSITGPQPRLPIYVQVHVKDVAFKDFLSEVAGQLGQRADIAMNGPAIELRYRDLN